MTNHKLASDLTISAFDDYTSGRFLLINGYPLNGVILGSLALEKHLKAIWIIATQSAKIRPVHFDRLDELKALFAFAPYDVIFNFPDPRFLELLSLAYRFRYYDNIKEKKTIGICVNQVLAELDGFFHYLDAWITTDTTFKQAMLKKDPRIFENNYFLNGLDKKEFCERECLFYGLHLDPVNAYPLITEGKKVITPYNGRLTQIQINEAEPSGPRL